MGSASMFGIPRWITVAAALFCAFFGFASYLSSGVTSEFVFFTVLAVAFLAASVMKKSWPRDALTWFGSRGGLS